MCTCCPLLDLPLCEMSIHFLCTKSDAPFSFPHRCSYCLQHASTLHVHPLLANFGVGLRWADLRHLVLSDRAAVDAGEALAKQAPDCEMFAKPSDITRLLLAISSLLQRWQWQPTLTHLQSLGRKFFLCVVMTEA